MISMLLAAALLQATDPASAAADRAAEEAATAAVGERIIDRWQAYIAWRACMIVRADALATNAGWDRDRAIMAATDGCVPEQRKFLEALDASGVPHDPDGWYGEVVTDVVDAAAQAAEGKLHSSVEPDDQPLR